MGRLLRSMLGPDPSPGPPYVHVLKLPETEEEMAANPFDEPMFTVARGGRRGRQYENGPLAVPAAFRRLPADPLPDTGNAGRYFPLT